MKKLKNDVFQSFINEKLHESQLNNIRGGDDPPQGNSGGNGSFPPPEGSL